MKKKILILMVGFLLIGSNVFAQDVSIDSDGNVTTGTTNTNGNLEVTGASGEDGIVGSTSGTGAAGVYGVNTTSNNYGILGYDNYGVYGNSSGGYAGYFQGDARVTGNLTVDGLLIGYTETDPVFTAWDKSTGISITESQITDLDHFTSADETDPVFTGKPAFGITSTQITNWDTAYGWGDHSSAGYDTTDDSWTGTGDVYITSGNVGIGTTSPQGRFHVRVDGEKYYFQIGTVPWGAWPNCACDLDWEITDCPDGLPATEPVGTICEDRCGSGFDAREVEVMRTDENDFVINNSGVGIGTTGPNSKLQVTGGDVYVETIWKGIILRSPDGSCFRVTVNNDGSFASASVTCP